MQRGAPGAGVAGAASSAAQMRRLMAPSNRHNAFVTLRRAAAPATVTTERGCPML